jgi:hypothetical protein
MTTTAPLEQRIRGFFEGILEERVPQRDIEASRQIQRDLAATSDSVSVGEPVDMLRDTIDWLAPHPGRWSQAIAMATVYLDSESKSGRPAVQISNLLLRELIRTNPHGLARFFSSMDDWYTFHALDLLVPSLQLDVTAATELLVRCEEFAPDDMVRPISTSSLVAWSAHNVVVAKLLVDDWLESQQGARRVPLTGLQPLVEGVMRSDAFSEQERLRWRKEVLKRLSDEPDERPRRLSAYLACFAWPVPGPVAQERHAALLTFVRRAPATLAPAAMDALARDAGVHPSEVLRTLGALIRLLSEARPEPGQRFALMQNIAHVTWRALSSKKDGGPALEGLDPIFEELMAFPPIEVSKGRSFDRLVSELIKIDRGLAESFLFPWLRAHARALLARGTSFDAIFPHLPHSGINNGILGEWLVVWLTDRDSSLRTYGARCVSDAKLFRPSMDVIRGLATSVALGLVYMLLGGSLLGAKLVSLLAQLTEERPDILPAVRAAMLEELALDYPEACRRWAEHIHLRTPAPPPHIERLAKELSAVLEEASRVVATKAQIPELLATLPMRKPWHEAESLRFERSYRAAAAESIASQIAMTVPIARGEGTLNSGPGAGKVAFSHHEFQVELPAREFADPVGFHLARAAHLERAAELLDGGGLPSER